MLRFSNLANYSESLFEQLDFFHNRKNISILQELGLFIKKPKICWKF